MKKRWKIEGVGIATSDGGLILTHARSRACGLWEGEHGGGDPDQIECRREVRRVAKTLADRLGTSVEIMATHPRWQSWMIDQIEPATEFNYRFVMGPDEVEDELERRGVSARSFWSHAAGGDRVPIRRDELRQLIRALDE